MTDMLDVFTPRHYAQIRRTRSELPRAAKHFGLSAEDVTLIREGRLAFAALWRQLYGDEVRVRLDREMADEPLSPAAGEIGELRYVSTDGDPDAPDAKLKLSVSWPGGSHLQILHPSDDFTLLAPEPRTTVPPIRLHGHGGLLDAMAQTQMILGCELIALRHIADNPDPAAITEAKERIEEAVRRQDAALGLMRDAMHAGQLQLPAPDAPFGEDFAGRVRADFPTAQQDLLDWIDKVS